MNSNEQLVRESVERMLSTSDVTAPVPVESGLPVAGVQEVIDRLLEPLANIDAEEAGAILAQIEQAVVAAMAGNRVQAVLAVVGVLRLYSKAIKD